METEQTIYERFESLTSESGVEQALDMLSQHFRDLDQPHQLFEVLKMQVRIRLGLPLLYGHEPDELDDATQKALEDGLLEACREVGVRLIEQGNLQQGWMYLQPVGDRQLVERLFKEIKVTEENSEEMIEVTLSQGAAPEIGYPLLMKQYGTCNAITTFDTQIAQVEKPLRKKLAAQLVRHLYSEIVENVKNHIAEVENSRPESDSLSELRLERDWLTEAGGHHVDTTHLASVVRIGRIVEDKSDVQMLLELTQYGRSLAEDFQYEGQPPFESVYVDHEMFYAALIGQNQDEAIKHFDNKAKTVDRDAYGNVAVETLVELLTRVGNRARAIDVSTESLLGQGESLGIAPNVFEIAKCKEDYERLVEYYQSKDDLLGFAIGVLKMETAK